MTRREYRRLVGIVRRRTVGKDRRDRWEALNAPREVIDNEMVRPGGLKAECDGCGACCRQLGIQVELADCDREPKLIAGLIVNRPVVTTRITLPVVADSEDDPDDEVVTIMEPVESVVYELSRATPCPMLAGNRCSIHATKPGVCRNSPAGGFCCQYSRAKEGLPALPLSRGTGQWS